MADRCIFCRIVAGEFNTEFVAENEHAVAFNDLSPAAPVHVLVVPRIHISGLGELSDADTHLATACLELANEVARKTGVVESGYRVLTNHGSDAGQTVLHLHFHVLGGKRLHEPLA